MARRLKINLIDLEFAFENSNSEANYYLDLDSGEVLFITDDIRREIQRVSAAADSQGIEFAEALAQSDLPDWEKEEAARIADIEERLGTSVIDIETDDSAEAYRDMEAFVDLVRDGALKDRLLAALSGGRPFRRFKDAIAANQREETRWFAFRDERLRRRVLEWLEDLEIEPID